MAEVLRVRVVALGRPDATLSGVEAINDEVDRAAASRGLAMDWVVAAKSRNTDRGSWSLGGMAAAVRGLLALAPRLRPTGAARVIVYLPLSQGGPGLVRDVLVIALVAAMRVRWRSLLTLTIHLHGQFDMATRASTPWRRASYRFAAGRADCIISCIPEHTLASRPTHFVDNTLPSSLVPPPELQGASPARPARVGYLGSINAGKGLGTLVRALRLLPQDLDLELRLVGDVSHHLDPIGRTRFTQEEWARDLACLLGDPRVSMVGYLHGREKWAEMSTWTVFCLPSWSEGMPLSYLEARALQLPAVVSKVGALAHLHEAGTLLVSPGSPEELASGIVTALALGRVPQAQDGPSPVGRTTVDLLLQH